MSFISSFYTFRNCDNDDLKAETMNFSSYPFIQSRPSEEKYLEPPDISINYIKVETKDIFGQSNPINFLKLGSFFS